MRHKKTVSIDYSDWEYIIENKKNKEETIYQTVKRIFEEHNTFIKEMKLNQ